MNLTPIDPSNLEILSTYNLEHKGTFTNGLNYQWWHTGPAWSRKKVFPAIMQILKQCKL